MRPTTFSSVNEPLLVTGFAQDFDIQIPAVFKDYSRTKVKVFKEL